LNPARQFVRELARVCAPGGRVIIVTWCHRVLQPGEERLNAEELVGALLVGAKGAG
jgi:tocopherol O-methyltransferase